MHKSHLFGPDVVLLQLLAIRLFRQQAGVQNLPEEPSSPPKWLDIWLFFSLLSVFSPGSFTVLHRSQCFFNGFALIFIDVHAFSNGFRRPSTAHGLVPSDGEPAVRHALQELQGPIAAAHQQSPFEECLKDDKVVTQIDPKWIQNGSKMWPTCDSNGSKSLQTAMI